MRTSTFSPTLATIKIKNDEKSNEKNSKQCSRKKKTSEFI